MSFRRTYMEESKEAHDPQGLLYLCGRYLEYLRIKHFSEDTVYARAKALKYFRVFCENLGITQAREVTRAVMVNYQSYLFHYRKEDGKALTLGTQHHRISDVVGFFSYLAKESLIMYNPAADLDMPRKEYRLPKAVLSVNEVEAIMSVPDISTPTGIKSRAIIEVFYSTGIRRKEMCNLEMNQIDFDRGLLRVEKGKGRKDRFVPIGERALKWVEKYLVEVRPLLCSSMNEPALFLNTLGYKMNPGRLGSHVHDIIEKAELGKSGSCHLFRHTFATVLLENGCDVRYVQAMLGHSKLETTEIYTHVSMRKIKEMHQRCHPARMPEEKSG